MRDDSDDCGTKNSISFSGNMSRLNVKFKLVIKNNTKVSVSCSGVNKCIVRIMFNKIFPQKSINFLREHVPRPPLRRQALCIETWHLQFGPPNVKKVNWPCTGDSYNTGDNYNTGDMYSYDIGDSSYSCDTAPRHWWQLWDW